MASVETSGMDRWPFGGGTSHTAEAARRALFTSTNGTEGVDGRSALKVIPQAPTGPGVRVTLGSGLILSRYVGGETQTYMATAYREQVVDVAPTGSAARSDLIVLRIEDPHASSSPWTKPPTEEIPDEQYAYVRVIQGVPAGTKRLQDVPGHANDTAITLARVDLKANIGAVDGTATSLITDLRTIARGGWEKTEVRAFGCQASGLDPVSATYPAADIWPSEASTNSKLSLIIPPWATQMTIIMTISGAFVPSKGATRGYLWVQVGDNGNASKVITETTQWDIDEESKPHRVVVRTADTKAIPAGLRGTGQIFYPRAARVNGTNASALSADWGTSVDLMVVFRETPI